LGGRPEQQCSSNIGNLRLKLAIIRYNLHKGKIAYQLWQRIPSICQMQYGATWLQPEQISAHILRVNPIYQHYSRYCITQYLPMELIPTNHQHLA
jgi:hypothetical protein